MEWAKDREPKGMLCARYGISRTLGYRIWKRFGEEGAVGLADRSRAPHEHPNQVSEQIEKQILELKQSHPHAGAPKLHILLGEQLEGTAPPATSTIGLILKRHGLTQKPKRRRQSPPYEQPLEHADEPNRVWCMDFKGWFRTQDGVRCDPLTISDAYSRYLIRCQALTPPDGARVKVLLEAVFREYGLPEAIRTDNGAPFASCGRGGLSRLSIWWIKLGIRPERIDPGKPQQNGRHERMHRTLKQHTAQPAAANGRAQQKAALGQRRPANLYQPGS
jgi:transposase InsO family protein